MAKNYYQILDLNRNCTDLDVIKAYKRLSLRYYPNKTKEDKVAASHIFNEISEAYEVLSDVKKRSCYDQLGEFGLKQGGPDGRGGYRYLNNAEDIFQSFFKSKEPLQALFDMETVDGSLFGAAMRGMNCVPSPKPLPLEVTVVCSLEELYIGCSKCLSFNRTTLNSDKVTTSSQSTSKNIDIQKGSVSGHRLVFPGEGNMSPIHSSSDLIFIISELPHSCFTRTGNDLFLTYKIKLLDCLLALPIQIEMLDKRVLTISFEEIIQPDSEKIIANEGMPVFGEITKGQLTVKFVAKFPKYISEEKRAKAIEILS